MKNLLTNGQRTRGNRQCSEKKRRTRWSNWEVRKKQSVAGFTEGRKTCCVCRKVQCFLLVNIMQPPKQPHGACVVILPSRLREYRVNSSREMRQWWSVMKSSIWQLRTLILELHHCMNLKKLNKVYYSRDCLERCLYVLVLLINLTIQLLMGLTWEHLFTLLVTLCALLHHPYFTEPFVGSSRPHIVAVRLLRWSRFSICPL